MDSLVERALARADAATLGERCDRVTSTPFSFTLTLGDPQATSEQLFSIFVHNGLLSDDGWLRPDVRLVVLGDYFDFGTASDRPTARRDGLRNLAWFAAHPRDQVVLILGNHDLARVGELLTVSDEDFAAAFAVAGPLYARYGNTTADDVELSAFFETYPMFPSVEVVARDFSGFCVAQRELMLRLLSAERFQFAWHTERVLVCHAGVTRAYLTLLGLQANEFVQPARVAQALNDALKHAVESWDRHTPFVLPHLHHVGNAEKGDSWGVLLHRPAHPEYYDSADEEERRRRCLPQEYPAGLTQVVGHIRDAKCRELLGPYAVGPRGDGSLRTLVVRDGGVRYALGLDTDIQNADARMIFVDGGMQHTRVEAYELLEVETLTRFQRAATE